MKHYKKLIAAVTIVGALGIAGTAYAIETMTPAQITADVTGKTVEDVTALRAQGMTYGEIASETGKLDEFKAEILEQKKQLLDQKVKEGSITQAKADQIYASLKANQATCDGTGSAKANRAKGLRSEVGSRPNSATGLCKGSGPRSGLGLGQGTGNRLGQNKGFGQGQGQHNGNGMNR